MIRTLALLLLLTPAATAQTNEAQDFVTANLISTLYHEFGHALIALTDTPQGDTEATADLLSVAFLDRFWEEDDAQSVTALTALSFELATQEAENPAYWTTHRLDVERYYNQVCLFYGANPNARSTLAEEFEIAASRAAECVNDYGLAAAPWEKTLAPSGQEAPRKTLALYGDAIRDIGGFLAAEMAELNARFALPRPVALNYAACDEENAFYDPQSATITICTEYDVFLERQAVANDL